MLTAQNAGCGRAVWARQRAYESWVMGRELPRAKLGALQLKGARQMGESGGEGHGLNARLCRSLL